MATCCAIARTAVDRASSCVVSGVIGYFALIGRCSHSGYAGVRVFEPGFSRAIQGSRRAAVRVCVA